MVKADTSEAHEGDADSGTVGEAAERTGQLPLEGLSEERRALLTLELARRKAVALKPRKLPREGAEPRFPLSYAQERLWFLAQADPESTAYVMSGALRLRGALDRRALSGALDEIVRRHEVLRTTFPDEGGRPEQRVGRPRPVALPVVNAAAEDEIAAALRAETTTPFDLTSDLMVRARLLRLSDTDHVLVLGLHHIAADGWTLGVLLRELGALYDAFQRGLPSPLAELETQYADYAVWQRDWLATGPLDNQIDYWRKRLDGAPVLELPADVAPTAARTWRGASKPFDLPTELWKGVASFAEEHRTTPYMVLVAAFAVVLARWSGERDVVIGSPLAGRTHPELEPLAGFFVNTLPLRVDVPGAASFATLLAEVKRTCTDAYAHQDVPFGKLVQALRPDRSLGPVPLVQVMLALRDVPGQAPALAGLDVEELDLATNQDASKFDLVLDLVPEPDGRLRCRVEFSTDLFEAATAGRIADAFVRVLEAALAEPDQLVDRLPLLSAKEREHLVGELSGVGDASAAEGRLDALVEAQAMARPDAPAVECGDTVLTYRELTARADRLAHRLRSLGAGPEHVIGVCLARSADMVVALLGILKAGAAYMPLDPGYPQARIDLMIRDSGVSLVVTDRAVAADGRLNAVEGNTGPTHVLLDDIGVEEEAEPLPGPAHPRTLAYVIYTSGSTGRPKGSANEHGGVVNTLTGLNRTLGLGPTDRMLAISSLNYDMSVYEILGSLLAGACVVVPPDDLEITDPVQLRRLVIDTRVTAWSSAPALLELLVNHAHGGPGLDGAALRTAVLGGDRLPPALAERLGELLPDLRLYNLAGMTEVSYCSTYHLVRRPEPVPGVIPWGRPLPNQRLYVLDAHGEPVPVGVRGELFIGGAGVRRGYWRRPALSAQRFTPDPFSSDPSGRLYRTGDAARWRSSGELEFLGRLDHQVKLRGLRIEPGEIEAALTSHQDVKRSIVLLRGVGTEQRLVAYLTTQGPLPPSVGELRRYLLDRLPDHMVPSAFMLMQEFPLQPSGKLDRAALPDPAADRPELSGAYVEPTTPLEKVLAGIWGEVLELDRVGVADDFFDLGGHSLLVTQAVSRIRDLFRVDFSIRGFLAAGTVLALADGLRSAAAEAGTDADRTAELILHVSGMEADQVARELAE
ncbi:non-ribosomal peptide synthetase [Streptomyces doebereineriae]|uniref:Amino acid adenylation domain-containing protein n=1 Tax=Streptomyces doebereineriae TaxID=3075528 RepID=A0ABU2VB36_9ACTN|nr:amino acid adenylation domain-containing protein [Streptomyces sp. DSM 41640]MDT0482760.1 amino acid adenylation domain-containing protein [Streptomyces sp. DSM 41640]